MIRHITLHFADNTCVLLHNLSASVLLLTEYFHRLELLLLLTQGNYLNTCLKFHLRMKNLKFGKMTQQNSQAPVHECMKGISNQSKMISVNMRSTMGRRSAWCENEYSSFWSVSDVKA